MSFGKRTGISDQHSAKPALAPTGSEQSNTLRNVFIGVAVLLALSYLGRQAMFAIGSYVGSMGDMAMQGTSNSSFGDFVRNAEEILQQEGDKVETRRSQQMCGPADCGAQKTGC